MNVSKSDSGRESFLNSIVLPNIKSKSPNICQREITEKYFWEDIFYEFLETA